MGSEAPRTGGARAATLGGVGGFPPTPFQKVVIKIDKSVIQSVL